MAYSDPEKEREFKKRWYQKNKEKHLKNVRKRTVSHRKLLAEIAQEYKKKCYFCPENDSCCLEFHHVDPKQKKLEISLAIRNAWSEEHLKQEIAKCLVVCRNCHSKIHKYGLENVELLLLAKQTI